MCLFRIKKIIYIANARLPSEHAHSVQIMKMCEAFSLAGFDVQLLVPFRFNTIKQSVWDYYNINPIFKIKKIPSLDLIPLAFLGKLSFWVSNISFSLCVLFYALLKPADIIYSRDMLSIIGISFFRKKCVFEMHSRYFGWGMNFLRRLKKIIVISKGLKQELVGRGVPNNKILVASDGVDLNNFMNVSSKKECRQELAMPAGALIIGYVGQLKTMGMEKGVGLLLSAFAKIRQKRPNLYLYLVGGWPFHVKEYIKNAGEGVHFIGQVPYNLIPKYLAGFDILLMPFPLNPHYMYDMSPLKMFEYMAAQKPIISSDLPAIREVIDDHSAFFFKPEDEVSLIQSIERALDRPEIALAKAQVARIKVEEFTWERRAEKIINFIAV